MCDYTGMKPEEIARSLSELGVSQASFAEYLGVREETVSRWVNGHEPVPRYAEIILGASLRAQHLIMHIKQDFLIPAGVGANARFNRNAYQREYMRKRRAAKKA